MLSVGLELKIIDQAIYSIMVVMALMTTAMAGPVLRRLRRPGAAAADEFLPVGKGPANKAEA